MTASTTTVGAAALRSLVDEPVRPLAETAAAPHAAAANAEPIVRLADATRRFGSTVALDGVDLEIARGEIFGIIGRSGAGKSTLIRTINALERLDSGRVVVDGRDLGSLDDTALLHLRRGIGMVFQHFNLLSAKTTFGNVELPLKLAGVPRDERETQVWRLLDLVGLGDKAEAYPAQLSGGQKQRVGIARALVARPSLLLSDEATSALDPETTLSILHLLRDLNRRLGVTIILITHEMTVIREICDRLAVLEAGRVVEQGPVWKVFGRPGHEVTRRLLRTVRPPLPEWLRTQLLDAPVAGGRTLVRVASSDDEGQARILGVLADARAGSVRIEHAEVDRIGSHAVGSVTFSVPSAAFDLLRSALSAPNAPVEVLGHVAG